MRPLASRAPRRGGASRRKRKATAGNYKPRQPPPPLLPLLLLVAVPPLLSPVLGSFSCHDFDGGTWDTLGGNPPDEPGSAGITTRLDFSFASPVGPSETVRLAKAPAGGDYFCVLFVKSYSEVIEGQDPADRMAFYNPVARSYTSKDGRATGEWEGAAGRYASAGTATVTYGGCHDVASVPHCELTLPRADVDEYYVTAYKHVNSDYQNAVRFLERASFGASAAAANDLLLQGATVEEAAASHVAAQQSVPPTSHREHFRTRLNPRSLELYKYGRTGPHPCRPLSRWRRFAFTRKDKVMSTGHVKIDWPMDMHNATLAIETAGGTDYAVWRYFGRVRTVLPLDKQPRWSDGTDTEGALIDEGTYRVCGVDEVPGDVYASEADRVRYARFRLEDPGKDPLVEDICTDVFGGNPAVQFPNDDPSAFGVDTHVLDFTSRASELRDIGYDPTQATNEADSVLLFNGTDYEELNEADCEALPDPDRADYRSEGWEYSPYYEGNRHPDWDPASRSVLDETVFAAAPGGKYYLHDRRFAPLENDIDSPLADGGGAQTIASVYQKINTADRYNASETADADLSVVDEDGNPRTPSSVSGEEQAIFCSNSRPNVFNEASCTLSADVNACVREDPDDEDTVVVTMLNAASATRPRLVGTENSLARMAVHLAGVDVGIPMEVAGLPYPSAGSPPCEFGAVSRFLRYDGGASDYASCMSAAANAQASPQTATADVFKHLLEYSVSNNELVRDVLMVSRRRTISGLAGLASPSDQAPMVQVTCLTQGLSMFNFHHHNNNFTFACGPRSRRSFLEHAKYYGRQPDVQLPPPRAVAPFFFSRLSGEDGCFESLACLLIRPFFLSVCVLIISSPFWPARQHSRRRLGVSCGR